MAAKSKLIREELNRMAAYMRGEKPIEQYVVLSEHVYDTLKFAYEANGEPMPSWIIRQVRLPAEYRKRRAKEKERGK